jgi:hypothetical protein
VQFRRIRLGRVRLVGVWFVGVWRIDTTVDDGVGAHDEGAGVEAEFPGSGDDGAGPGGGVVDDPVVVGEEGPEDLPDPLFGLGGEFDFESRRPRRGMWARRPRVSSRSSRSQIQRRSPGRPST